jgi:ATP-dependent DNA ligase
VFCITPLADGAAVFAKAWSLASKASVSKREGSFYRCGRSRNWLKAKNPNFVRKIDVRNS